MGMDARYYIGGFTAPAGLHEDVIAVVKALEEDPKHDMYVSSSDKQSRFPMLDDGYCVVESNARAYSSGYKNIRAAQLRTLRVMFPDRPIYMSDDYVNREDAIKDFAENPSKHKDLSFRLQS